MSPDPLEYHAVPAPPPRVDAPPDPAAGISGFIVSLLTIAVYFGAGFLVRFTEAGVLMMASVFALWPLGLVLSIMGLTRPGARVLAGIGTTVSVVGARLVIAAVARFLRGQ